MAEEASIALTAVATKHSNRDKGSVTKHDEKKPNDFNSEQSSVDAEKCSSKSVRLQGQLDVKYRTMAWWQAGVIMIAETISLGILSLPSALATVGLIPGIILIVGLGILATYTGYVIGQFKLAYPQVHNMADAGFVMAGPIGREILGMGQLLFYVFLMGSHILTFAIMMNTVTAHGTCTIVFAVVGTIISLIFSLPRKMEKISYLSIISFASIASAVMVTIVGVGIESPGHSVVAATVQRSFSKGFLAVMNIIFAFSGMSTAHCPDDWLLSFPWEVADTKNLGHVAFFAFISELRHPKSFPKALCLLQGVMIPAYLLVAILIYYFAGAHVASPALGSASPLLRKIAYGIATPTIVIAGVINGHVASKYIYVRHFKEQMSQSTWASYGIWAGIVCALWGVAWIIAEAIPVFNDLLALISALFASWFTYGLSGVFWLFLNYGQYGSGSKKLCLSVLNVGIVILGAVMVSLPILHTQFFRGLNCY